jgi:hypothetical protein
MTTLSTNSLDWGYQSFLFSLVIEEIMLALESSYLMFTKLLTRVIAYTLEYLVNCIIILFRNSLAVLQFGIYTLIGPIMRLLLIIKHFLFDLFYLIF